MKAFLLTILAMLLVSCGVNNDYYDPSVPTQLPPYVNRIAPANGSAGDTVSIFGYGFSEEFTNNVVSFGNYSISASGYTLVSPATATEIEILTVTVPAGIPAGTYNVYVTVFDNTSNNVTFTVP